MKNKDAWINRLIWLAGIVGIVSAMLAFFFSFTVSSSATNYVSKNERQWLRDFNRTLRVGVTTIPNQVLRNSDGSLHGFSVDVFKLIESKIGTRIAFVYFESWNDVMDAAKTRKIDIVFLAQKTPSRLNYLNFTDTVLTLKNKIIVNNDAAFQPTLETLSRAKVAVTKGSAVEEYLKTHFDGIELVECSDELEALRMLDKKKVDATVVEPVRAGYYMSRYNLDRLHIAQNLNYDYHLAVASRNDMPFISILLDKALQSISPQEMEALYLKWGYLQNDNAWIDPQTLVYLFIALTLITLFAFYLYRTNKQLAVANRNFMIEVKKRKKAYQKLHQVLEEHKQLNETLEKRIAQEVEKNRQQELYMLHQNRLAQMGELLSMIAHQWRQPLHTLSVLNYTLIKKYRDGVLDENAVTSFEEKSKKQIAFMSKTINDFRDFFSSQAERERFDVNDTVRQTVEMIEATFQQYNIALSLRLCEESLYITGSPSALAQALLNIANNAKDALLKHDVSDKTVIFGTRREGDTAVAWIEDNAGGIPEAIRERIFDPYFSTKEEKDGTGLGLYMSKKIVEEQFGGKLFVRNTEEGACFTIRIDTGEDL